MFCHQFSESSLSFMGSAVEPIHFLCQVLHISVLKFLLISSLYVLGLFAENFFFFSSLMLRFSLWPQALL